MLTNKQFSLYHSHFQPTKYQAECDTARHCGLDQTSTDPSTGTEEQQDLSYKTTEADIQDLPHARWGGAGTVNKT